MVYAIVNMAGLVTSVKHSQAVVPMELSTPQQIYVTVTVVTLVMCAPYMPVANMEY